MDSSIRADGAEKGEIGGAVALALVVKTGRASRFHRHRHARLRDELLRGLVEGLPVSAARGGHHAVEPSVGDGHHLHRDGARGFVVLDWSSRRVLSWRLSITMEAAFCIETLEDALGRYGKPEIFNTDRGS